MSEKEQNRLVGTWIILGLFSINIAAFIAGPVIGFVALGSTCILMAVIIAFAGK